MFKKIIVGVDFTEENERILELAGSLGAGLRADVVLLHVLSGPVALQDPSRSVADVRAALEERMRKLSAELQAKKPEARIDWGIVDGRPAEELATFADRWGGDVIVVASAGRSGLPRAILGSVADRLVRTSRVPVLVIGPAT